ncbi:MAG: acyl-CoA dehydrogenase family protein [Desulfobacula sp.]|jgi:butyryl-CoA dehydrogenase|nr:acyl-CoA dehydrogenase family protein [Desulfobacula sp.]
MTIALSIKEKKIFEKAKDFSISNFTSEKRKWKNCDKSFKDAVKIFSNNGYCGIGLPSELGGQGYNFLEQALIYEGLAYGCGVLSFLIQTHNNVTKEIGTFYDTPEEIKKLLPDMAGGKKINAFALTEESSGNDPSAITSYAELKADGYHIHGKKMWIVNAAEASHFNVMVKDGSPNSNHILMILLDRNTKGLTIGKKKPIMGLSAMSCCDMEFNNCTVSKKRLLSDKGYEEALRDIDAASVFLPSISMGIAQRVIDITVNYLGQRISFDKPIISRQGVQWELADLTAKVEAGRWLVYKTASVMDSKNKISIQAYKNNLYATEVAMETTTKCLQFFGAEGFTENSVLSENWALAKLLQIVAGASEMQKIVIGRDLEKQADE